MRTVTLSTLGLPLAGVGLLLAIDPVLDLGRTAVDVVGQALVPTIVVQREGVLDQSRYDAPRGRQQFSQPDVRLEGADRRGARAGRRHRLTPEVPPRRVRGGTRPAG